MSVPEADVPFYPGWKRLEAVAQAQVTAVLQSLPEPLQARARLLPITFEHCPSHDLVAEGIEPDTLGLFVGPAFAEEDLTPTPIPAQIILFLDNLWDMAEGEEEVYAEELRTTLLHELGHYLGLNEDDLTDRGLE